MSKLQTYLDFVETVYPIRNLRMVNDIMDWSPDNAIAHKKGYSHPRKIKVYRMSEIRTTPKIGRNQICECGSGLKSKKCCK